MNTSKSKKKQLNWSETAKYQRFKIWDYIVSTEQNIINATLVDSRILQAAERLASMPEIGKAYGKGLRILMVSKTGYAVVYRVTSKSVNILRISHQRRRVL